VRLLFLKLETNVLILLLSYLFMFPKRFWGIQDVSTWKLFKLVEYCGYQYPCEPPQAHVAQG
jgi:hypothetical protein